MRRLLLLLAFLALALRPATAQRAPEEESRLEDILAAVSPEAVPLFHQATQAMDEGDGARAVEGYREVLELAPGFVPAIRRLSYVHPDREESLRLARRAPSLEDHGYNLTAVVQALLRFDDPASRSEAHQHARRLIDLLPGEMGAMEVVARASIWSEDRELLARAIDALDTIGPESVPTHYNRAIAAVIDEEWERAEAEIHRAQELGLPEEEARRLLEGTGIETQARAWRYVRYVGYGFVAWLLGLVLLFAMGILLSRLTLRTIENRASLAAAGRSGGAALLMRRAYAIVLHITSFYYYLSIPVVLLLVIGAGGGVIYALLELGRIPIRLLLVVIVLVAVTVFGIIKSLFVRAREQDPGLRLTEQEAPELFTVIREVAGKIGTPPVDSVFVVPGSEIAVFERRSLFQHLGRGPERCLVIGLGALQGMTLLQFKAILGHEYGHLSNRDTAGGRVALHVRRSILASAEALASGGAAAWYNPAWLFLRAFNRLYLQVSQGASRLQEVLADRWAAFAYGARAFADGLRHVIRRAVEFGFVTNHEINLALQQSRPLSNLYKLPIPAEFVSGDERPAGASTPSEAIEQAVQSAMTAPGSPFDNHPRPSSRIDWIGRLEGMPVLEDSYEDAMQLLPGKERLQELMTKQVGDQVQAYLAYQEALARQESAGGDDEITTIGSLIR